MCFQTILEVEAGFWWGPASLYGLGIKYCIWLRSTKMGGGGY